MAERDESLCCVGGRGILSVGGVYFLLSVGWSSVFDEPVLLFFWGSVGAQSALSGVGSHLSDQLLHRSHAHLLLHLQLPCLLLYLTLYYGDLHMHTQKETHTHTLLLLYSPSMSVCVYSVECIGRPGWCVHSAVIVVSLWVKSGCFKKHFLSPVQMWSFTSPSDRRTSVITLWMSSLVLQYSPRIHSAPLYIL